MKYNYNIKDTIVLSYRGKKWGMHGSVGRRFGNWIKVTTPFAVYGTIYENS